MKLRMMMKGFALVAGIALLVLASCATGQRRYDSLPSLKLVWADYFPMGNIIASIDYSWRIDRVRDIGNPAREALLARHFEILTAEDEMKPNWIRPNRVTFRTDGADRIVNFAQENNMRIHGHVLAWHVQSPWFLNIASSPPSGWAYGQMAPPPLPRDQAIANLVDHIEQVMRHFGDSIDSWEVLNEIFPSTVAPGVTPANWRERLRNTPWNRAIPFDPATGNCFIWYAFTAARRVADEINPNIVLYYNDYNEDTPNKRAAIYYMVREINERFARENNGRRLIDAVGMQAHYHRAHILGDPTTEVRFGHRTNVNNVRDSIQRFATLGVYVSITELDVTVGHTGFSPQGRITRLQEREQAIMFAQLFQIFRDNAQHLRRVSLWGIDDPASWRHEGSPLLFDGDLRPKEAFWASVYPDAFVNPANGQPRSNAEIDAFLRNPRNSIPDRYWVPHMLAGPRER